MRNGGCFADKIPVSTIITGEKSFYNGGCLFLSFISFINPFIFTCLPSYHAAYGVCFEVKIPVSTIITGEKSFYNGVCRQTVHDMEQSFPLLFQ